MTKDEAIAVMSGFFAARGEEAPTDLENQRPREVLRESLDVVDFVVYLEEELKIQLDIQELGETLLGRTFGELATELAHRY